MKLTAALALSLTLFLAGCGGGSDDGSGGETLDGDTSSDTSAGGESKIHDESEIVEHLGLVDDGGGSYTYTTPDGVSCGIAVVLTKYNEVSMYRDAGDTVAENSSGTAGVKIIAAEEATCKDALDNALTDFE
jgi:hypothetical protein